MDAEAQLIIYDATTGFERLKNAYKEQADELEAVTQKLDIALLKVRECEQALAEYDSTAERYPGIEF